MRLKNLNPAGVLVIMAVLTICPIVWASVLPQVSDEVNESDRSLRIHIKPLPEGVSRLYLVNAPNGRRQFELVHIDGSIERLSTEAFAERLDTNQKGKPWFYQILNITSPVGFAWVFLGLLGQVLFTGRLLLQWLVSEKAKRCVVPVGYWWMSLIGASMLLVYFIWRRDIIGVLGLGTGWLIYGRNLWLIYFPKGAEIEFETGMNE